MQIIIKIFRIYILTSTNWKNRRCGHARYPILLSN